MKLVIVESPSKAKTIEKYLGKEYSVRASVGHVRDLPKSNKAAIDIEGGFIPHYVVTPGKEKVIAELKHLTAKADEVFLATDPDREGEAISHHLAEVLGLKKAKRVVFHEITKEAVTEAFNHPRPIDEKLVRAQEARRVLDRLMGYGLSGLIWKKVRYGLSAGRVQSPALRILMEREREIRAFIPENFWVITADTLTQNKKPITFTYSQEPKTQDEADRVVEEAKKNKWQVADVDEGQAKRSPKPPFTTSTLQQSASTRLGLSPSNTMRIAQKLYEAGHITYMRTDSLNLSKEAMAVAAGVIEKKWGKNYVEVREYKTKSKNAQEAHEAIRPTHVDKLSAGASEDQKKLYKLIWERMVASQMSDAQVLKTKISAEVQTPRSDLKGSQGPTSELLPFVANGSRVVFDGWLAADPRARGEDAELPKVAKGEALECLSVASEGKQTEPPNRFTEAGLIKELEKRGIGRPSTYASISKTIVDRGYVAKEGRTLIPTDTGDVVSTFLEKNFENAISDSFTADMEEELDEIASGEKQYEPVLSKFYKPFAKELKLKDKSIGKITTLGDTDDKWKCPTCGGKMVWKLGRSGKFMSCERFPDCSGSRTATGEEMKAPQETGETCPLCGEKDEGKLVERIGRFGTFIACSRYPKCKYVKEDEEAKKRADTGVQCPICPPSLVEAGKKGTMGEKRGRFGVFYGCSNYPECKNIVKAKPTGKLCDLCGSLMMEGTKTIPERCSKKECPNHNPHKKEKTAP
ncbi:MAG TPA: type I DNA topoisomerase [Candidatus Paceibacterota bacterium]